MIENATGIKFTKFVIFIGNKRKTKQKSRLGPASITITGGFNQLAVDQPSPLFCLGSLDTKLFGLRSLLLSGIFGIPFEYMII